MKTTLIFKNQFQNQIKAKYLFLVFLLAPFKPSTFPIHVLREGLSETANDGLVSIGAVEILEVCLLVFFEVHAVKGFVFFSMWVFCVLAT